MKGESAFNAAMAHLKVKHVVYINACLNIWKQSQKKLDDILFELYEIVRLTSL